MTTLFGPTVIGRIPAVVEAVAPLPARLRRSLTWDQGVEMSRHDEFTRASNVAVYFCEPASRGFTGCT